MKKQVDWDWLQRAMELRPETPAGKSGDVEVTHEIQSAGTKLPVVSMRNAIFMGQRPSSVRFDVDVIYRALVSKAHGTWMTDSAQEVYQCRDAIQAVKRAGKCNLLIGGLGLGCYSQLAMRMTRANVTTVERSKDVIKLVGDHIIAAGKPHHRIVRDCIYKFSKQMAAGEYDVALLDTWQATGEFCWVKEVIPLRRITRPKVAQVYCWNEEEMIGQFKMSAHRKMLFDPREIPGGDAHHRTVSLAARDEGIIGKGLTRDQLGKDEIHEVFAAEAALSLRPEAREIVDAFAHDVGSPEWERRFGRHWERAIRIREAGRRKSLQRSA